MKNLNWNTACSILTGLILAILLALSGAGCATSNPKKDASPTTVVRGAFEPTYDQNSSTFFEEEYIVLIEAGQVGAELAKSIVEYEDKHGSFKTWNIHELDYTALHSLRATCDKHPKLAAKYAACDPKQCLWVADDRMNVRRARLVRTYLNGKPVREPVAGEKCAVPLSTRGRGNYTPAVSVSAGNIDDNFVCPATPPSDEEDKGGRRLKKPRKSLASWSGALRVMPGEHMEKLPEVQIVPDKKSDKFFDGAPMILEGGFSSSAFNGKLVFLVPQGVIDTAITHVVTNWEGTSVELIAEPRSWSCQHACRMTVVPRTTWKSAGGKTVLALLPLLRKRQSYRDYWQYAVEDIGAVSIWDTEMCPINAQGELKETPEK